VQASRACHGPKGSQRCHYPFWLADATVEATNDGLLLTPEATQINCSKKSSVSGLLLLALLLLPMLLLLLLLMQQHLRLNCGGPSRCHRCFWSCASASDTGQPCSAEL